MLAGLGLLLVTANMAVHLEDAKDVDKSDLNAFVKALRAAITEDEGTPPTIDRKVGYCISDPDCLGEVAVRTKAELILFLTISPPTKKRKAIHVEGEMLHDTGRPWGNASIDLELDQETFPDRAKEFVAQLRKSRPKGKLPQLPPREALPAPQVVEAPPPPPVKEEPPPPPPPEEVPEDPAKLVLQAPAEERKTPSSEERAAAKAAADREAALEAQRAAEKLKSLAFKPSEKKADAPLALPTIPANGNPAAEGPVGIHLEAAKSMDSKALGAVGSALREALKSETGQPLVVDKELGKCFEKPGCADKARKRMKASEVVHWTVTGGAKVKLDVLRVIGGRDEPIEASLELDKKDLKGWSETIKEFVRGLYGAGAAPGKAEPAIAAKVEQATKAAKEKASKEKAAQEKAAQMPEVAARPGAAARPEAATRPEAAARPPATAQPKREDLPTIASAPAPAGTADTTDASASLAPPDASLEYEKPSSGFKVWPWVALGGTAVAAGAGIFLGLHSAQTRIDAEATSHSPAEADSLQSEVFATGLSANILFGVAAAGAVATVLLFVQD